MRNEQRDGTQLIGRVASILRNLPLGTGPGTGKRLVDLSKATGLNEATLRRILQALVRERLVVRDSESKRFRVGPLPLELGLASGYLARFSTQRKPLLKRLASETGLTSVLAYRSGLESVALIEEAGGNPIHVRLMDQAGRLPLGVSTGGVALMMNMNDEEIAEVFELPVYDTIQLTREELAKRVHRARELGYADISDVPIQGIRGVAVPVPSYASQPALVLSVVSVRDQVQDENIPQIVETLRKYASKVSEAVAEA
ncbi:MAG: helix-turn-helix domain-containing protein [Pararhodobacter sp.]|nr:helix-turn-helix domain-containing protein [Pararhodobacter sp.]